MDYEKKYNEALERVRRLHDRMLVLSSTDALVASAELEFIFPELSESEDERIRKELVAFFKGMQDSDWHEKYWHDLEIDRILAYLEKQKETGIQWFKSDNVKNPDKPYIDKAGMFYTTDGRMCYASEIEKQKELPFVKDVVLGYPGLYFYDGERMHFRGSPAMEEKQKEQKPAWSEEDEKKITFLERLIRYNVPEGQYGWADGHKSGFITKSEAISKLKSLRPSWKPSEEQMKALEAATVRYQSTGLESLYEDLKKLM